MKMTGRWRAAARCSRHAAAVSETSTRASEISGPTTDRVTGTPKNKGLAGARPLSYTTRAEPLLERQPEADAQASWKRELRAGSQEVGIGRGPDPIGELPQGVDRIRRRDQAAVAVADGVGN